MRFVPQACWRTSIVDNLNTAVGRTLTVKTVTSWTAIKLQPVVLCYTSELSPEGMLTFLHHEARAKVTYTSKLYKCLLSGVFTGGIT